MSERTATAENFLVTAAATLGQIEYNLTELAQAALVEHQRLTSEPGNGHQADANDRASALQRLSHQLLKLSEQSGMLRTYLQDDLTALPWKETSWPQIRILQSQEEERTQLARELEDGVGQLLANAIFELASCRRLLEEGQEVVAEGLDALQTELEQGLADVRHFITDLEPATVLSNFGLAGGIRRYLEQYEAKTGLKTQLLIRANIGRLPSIIETAIFRVIQEALSNVHHHAGAARVDVVVEERDGALQFSVIDNGNGLVSEKIATGKRNLGLVRMIDYADLLNGKLKILSEPERGTQVTLIVPYQSL